MESTYSRAIINASIRSCRPTVSALKFNLKAFQTLSQQQQRRNIRTIRKKAFPLPNNTDEFPLGASPAAAHARKVTADVLPLRTGALAIKKGMSSLYDTSGERTPCTVLQMDRVQVVGHKTQKKHGYDAVCLGYGWRDPKNIHNAQLAQWANTIYQTERGPRGISPKKNIKEFRVKDQEGLLPIGTWVSPSWFKEGQFVDTRSKSKGHGFTGVMKKWGFHGQPASHGVSLTHRSLGSAGGGQGSGSRVIPGKKMAGRMGNERHTVQNLKVLKVDDANGLVVVNGCVSGPKGCLVQVQDALKKPWPVIITDPPSGQEAAQQLREAA